MPYRIDTGLDITSHRYWTPHHIDTSPHWTGQYPTPHHITSHHITFPPHNVTCILPPVPLRYGHVTTHNTIQPPTPRQDNPTDSSTYSLISSPPVCTGKSHRSRDLPHNSLNPSSHPTTRSIHSLTSTFSSTHLHPHLCSILQSSYIPGLTFHSIPPYLVTFHSTTSQCHTGNHDSPTPAPIILLAATIHPSLVAFVACYLLTFT